MREVCNFVGWYNYINHNATLILLSTGEFFLPQRVCLLDMCISVVCIRSFPCQCLCHWRGILVAGFSNGTIRLYNTETGRKMAEIAAHGRSVTGVDTAQDSGLLLSVSEDCTASVWGLTEETSPKVTHLCRLSVGDHLLCGGRFCDPLGDTLALAAFDSRTVLTYRRLSQLPHHQPPDHPQT
jgi:WD40 repeat protein